MQVINLPQSPGTGNLGKGQYRAATEFSGTLSGHLNPMIAKKKLCKSYWTKRILNNLLGSDF